MKILAFDPGKNVGWAVLDETGALKAHGVVDLTDVAQLDLSADVCVVGSGTGSSALVAVLRELSVEPVIVDEAETTLEGRRLYFRDRPGRGLSRLLPVGMRTPPRPIDDYAAYAIGLRYLAMIDSEGGDGLSATR